MIVIVAVHFSNNIAVPYGKGTVLFFVFFFSFEDDPVCARLPAFILFPSYFFLPSSYPLAAISEQPEYTSCSTATNSFSRQA
jgi:hypothetical protein